MNRIARTWIGVSGLVLVVALALMIGFYAAPADRMVREHGFPAPAGASGLECGGDAWKRRFADCGAISAFEIPAADLPAFLGKLSIRKTSKGVGDTIVPGNSQYVTAKSWAYGSPDFSYACDSPTGDFLTVRTWDLPASRVGVLLYTDWN